MKNLRMQVRKFYKDNEFWNLRDGTKWEGLGFCRKVGHVFSTSYSMGPGVFSPGVKRPGREAVHLPPASAEVKKIWICTSTSPYAFRGSTQLVKHRDNFIFYKKVKSITETAWTVFARWNTVVVGSNPTWGMHICMRLFCVCVLLFVGSGLATGWSPVQGILPSVYRTKKLRKGPRSNKSVVGP
jgi:hypothetical protein